MSRRRGAEAIRSFREVFGRSNHCAMLVARDQTVLAATPAARQIFDPVQEGVIQPQGLPHALEQAIARAFDGHTIRLELPRPGNDGGYQLLDVIVQPIRDENAPVPVALALIQAYEAPERHRDAREEQSLLLSQIALAVGQTENVTHAVTATLRHICEATGWILGEAWIPRASKTGGPVLERRGVWSSADAQLGTFITRTDDLKFQPGEGIPGTAWQRRSAVWAPVLSESPLFTRQVIAATTGLCAAVGIPLVATDAEDVVAVLVFFMRDVSPDHEQFVALASAVVVPLARLLRQKQAEEDHRVIEARLAGMVSIASDAIISVNAERRITLFNWGAEHIFGYTASEVMGQLIDMLLPEALRARHAAHIAGFAGASRATRRMGERSRIVGLRKNGEVFPAEASISRFVTAGEVVYTVMLRDVGDRVRAEEELRTMADRMREAAVSRDAVIAIVSHDLRNPLHTVEICLSGLADDPPPTAAQAGELVSLARESITVMKRIIQDLLDVASIEAGRLSVERMAQPVSPILQRAVGMNRMLAAEAGLALLLEENAVTDGCLVDVDGERIAQVLSNLIGNACKFTHPGGRITISTLELPDAVQVTVRDTGCGIPLDAIPHVFDRFWHARRSRGQRSAGLGLAIARGIIEAHGGRIWVESTVGEGSAFYLTLPFDREPRPEDDGHALSDDGRRKSVGSAHR